MEAYERLWWEGVVLWYNDRDYLGAMESWDRAIETVDSWWDKDDDDDDDDDDNDDENHLDKEEWPECLETFFLMEQDKTNASVQSSVVAVRLAPLLLFLSGCYLDANRVEKSRRLLYRCLASCCSSAAAPATSSIATTFSLAVQALLNTYEDEIHQNGNEQALQDCRRIVQWAMDQQQQRLETEKTGRFTRWRDPYQRPGYVHSSIPYSPAVYTRNAFPSWTSVLEDHWCMIRDEYLDCRRRRRRQENMTRVGNRMDGTGSHDGRVVHGKGNWNEVVLFGSGSSSSFMAPNTRRLLQRHVPQAVTLAQQGGGEVIFSCLEPHTHIRPHCGPTNLRLTAHLGLIIPSSSPHTSNDDSNDPTTTTTTANTPNNNNNNDCTCRIRIANHWHTWQPGKILLFDDSYEHEVRNDTNEVRVVLLLRFWHPHLHHHDETSALESALQAKQDDGLRPYNPPLPTGVAVHNRGMQHTQCPQCLATGYDSIRIQDVPVCAYCAHPIQ